jgi:tRNA(adenine34) deaminase
MAKVSDAQHDRDEAIMTELVRFTRRSFRTSRPIPFGAAIVCSKTGELLCRACNAVLPENDPSSHAELRAVRRACKKLGKISLAGHTLYSTCEPCAMCMANALWAGLDRVVFGATIDDASRHCNQIHIAAREVAERSDMSCAVVGEVLRDLCYGLFTDPVMLESFKTWGTRRK